MDDGNTDQFMYKNGVAIATDPSESLKPSDYAVDSNIYFANGFWSGKLDEVRISNVARPAAWMLATYESGMDDFLTFGSEESGIGTKMVLTGNMTLSGMCK